MRTNIKDIIASQPRQHTVDWYKNRLGHFTGSQVGRLMKKGRGKDADWSADAITYIKEVVAERLINPVVLDIPDLFDQYLDFTTASSKMMAWGNDNEDKALKAYATLTKREITACGAIQHESIKTFWDSPDGLLLDANGAVEVKCPAPKAHALYLINVKTPEDLLAVKPEYYWQCFAHMAVSGAEFTDWMSYCPFLKPSLHIVTIPRNEDTIHEMLERIVLAEDLAQELMTKALQR